MKSKKRWWIRVKFWSKSTSDIPRSSAGECLSTLPKWPPSKNMPKKSARPTITLFSQPMRVKVPRGDGNQDTINTTAIQIQMQVQMPETFQKVGMNDKKIFLHWRLKVPHCLLRWRICIEDTKFLILEIELRVNFEHLIRQGGYPGHNDQDNLHCNVTTNLRDDLQKYAQKIYLQTVSNVNQQKFQLMNSSFNLMK